MLRHLSRCTCLLVALLATTTPAQAVIWDGPDITITNPFLGGVQDMITSNVIITRGETQGIYNAAQEAGYDQIGRTSPADTKWAFLGLNANAVNPADITASNFANLTFADWAAALDGSLNLQGNIVNRPGVLHLVSDDIYLNIMFTQWGGGDSGGTFSYTRSTQPAPPLPGDTDGDGDVDDADLGTAFSNYTGPGGTGKSAAQGDTDGDTDIDDGDLGVAFSNYTGPLGPITPAVPEPASLALLSFGGLALATRRRD